MFDASAIKKLTEAESITAANNAVRRLNEDRLDIVTLPENFKNHDLETYMPTRRRARGTMSTTVASDFVEYTKLHQELGAEIFVSPENMSATTVLNLGTPEMPGHADNLAKLNMVPTAAYISLVKIANGTGMPQTAIAEFLEDWRDHILCENNAGDIEIGQAIAAVRNVTIEGLRKTESKFA